MSSVDIDKASLQEIVDKLSVMMLHLHEEVRHLRDENAQIKSESLAKQPEALSTQTAITASSNNGPVEAITSISTAGKSWRTNCCMCS
jgi:hypothetical protein